MGRMIWIARRPVESIIFMMACALLGFGLYVLSPWYVVSDTASIQASIFGEIERYVIGIVFTLTAVPGLVGVFLKDPLSSALLKMSTFWMFLDFLFLAVLRLSTIGWAPPHWMPLLVLALVAGFNRVYLQVRKE